MTSSAVAAMGLGSGIVGGLLFSFLCLRYLHTLTPSLTAKTLLVKESKVKGPYHTIHISDP